MMDDRAVSTTFNYVLSLGIASLLVTGLLLTGSNFVTDSREDVIRNELEVIGEQVASDVERIDRLAVAGDGTTVASTTQEFPTDVTGSTYDVVLDPSADPRLEVRSTSPEVSVGVTISTEMPVGDSHADGGPVTVSFDSSTGELVIDNG